MLGSRQGKPWDSPCHPAAAGRAGPAAAVKAEEQSPSPAQAQVICRTDNQSEPRATAWSHSTCQAPRPRERMLGCLALAACPVKTPDTLGWAGLLCPVAGWVTSSCAGQETGQPPLPPGHGLGDAAPVRSILPTPSPSALPEPPGDARAFPLPKAASIPALSSHCPASLVPPSHSQGAGTQHLKWADTTGARAGLAALTLPAAVLWVPCPLRTHGTITWRGPGWEQAATEPRQDAGAGAASPLARGPWCWAPQLPLPTTARGRSRGLQGGADAAPAPGEGLILPPCSQAPDRSTAWAASTSRSVRPLCSTPPPGCAARPHEPPGPLCRSSLWGGWKESPPLHAVAGAASCAHPGPCATGVPAGHTCPHTVLSPDVLCRQWMLCGPLRQGCSALLCQPHRCSVLRPASSQSFLCPSSSSSAFILPSMFKGNDQIPSSAERR